MPSGIAGIVPVHQMTTATYPQGRDCPAACRRLRYASRSNYPDAVRTLEAGASRRNDPLLMRMAADHHLRAGDIPRLNVPPRRRSPRRPGWSGEFRVRMTLFQAHEAQGHQDEATQRARLLVASILTIWTPAGPRLLPVSQRRHQRFLERPDSERRAGAAPATGTMPAAWIALTAKYDISGRSLAALWRP
jgi:hypothetical protein